MKRMITSVLALCALAFAQTAGAADIPRLNLATAGTTGIYYALGGTIAQVLKEKGVAEITVQATGGAGENLRLIQSREVQIAFTQNDLAYAAFNAIEPYKTKFTNLRAIGCTHQEVLHVVVRKGTNIKDIKDFKGQKISLGARGSGNEANCRQIFPFYGLSYSNIEPIFLPYGESADMFKDRQIDGFIFTFPYPHPIMLDITTNQEVDYLPITGKVADDIIAKFPYYFKTVIPAGTYKGQTQDVHTLGVKAMLMTHDQMPADTIYRVTKGIFENLPAIAAGHNKGKEISLGKALESCTLPLHPGAEKYYKEKGIIK